MNNAPNLESLAHRVNYWFNRISAARHAIQKFHLENSHPITGCLKPGVSKSRYTLDETCLMADLNEAQVNFNRASAAHGDAVRASLNGQSLHVHEEQERLRAQAQPVNKEVPGVITGDPALSGRR